MNHNTIEAYDLKDSKCKVPSHQNNMVQYFCLEEFCFNKRLFCQTCARLDHKKHRIGRIDRLIEPLSLLNINSFHEDSQTIYTQLKKKMDDFHKVITDLKKIFQITIEEIQRTSLFQINAILSTFNNQKIEEVQNLFLSPSPDQASVKTAIEMISFLQFDGVQDSYTLKSVTDILLTKMITTFEKTASKISSIFDKLLKNYKQNDFINQLKLYNLHLQNSAMKKIQQQTINNPKQQKPNSKQQKLNSFQNIKIQSQSNEKVDEQTNAQELQTNKRLFIKNSVLSGKNGRRQNLESKFKAFFNQQSQLNQHSGEKSKRQKNIVLVKKPQTSPQTWESKK